MRVVEIFRGQRFRVTGIRGDDDESSHVEAYISTQPREQQLKLLKAIRGFADRGPNSNPEKCRRLKGSAADLIELKRKPSRLMGFYCPINRGVLVLTHGFTKRSQETPPAEIRRALGLREEYLRWLRS